MCKYHPKCDGVKVKEMNARLTSDRLKLYCTNCCTNTANSTDKQIKLILRYIYKIDATTQEQMMHQVNIVGAMQKILVDNSKINAAINAVNKDEMSYAGKVKSGLKPAVIIKPKNQQSSNQTMNHLKNNVSRNDFNACGVRNIKGGGILISCDSKQNTMQTKESIEAKIGDQYEVKLPKMKSPRLKILGIKDKLNDNEIIKCLKEHNEYLQYANIMVKTVIKRDKYNTTLYDVIIEIEDQYYDIIMKTKKVYIGWHSYNVVEHMHIIRCFKCCGFNHRAAECKNKLACAKCAGEHKTTDCTKTEYKCVNCDSANKKFNLNLTHNHHAWSRECIVLERKFNTLRNNIQYSE